MTPKKRAQIIRQINRWRVRGRLPLVHIQTMSINQAVHWLITGRLR